MWSCYSSAVVFPPTLLWHTWNSSDSDSSCFFPPQLWSSGFWPRGSLETMKQTQVSWWYLSTWTTVFISSLIHLPLSFGLRRGALLQKGHAGWGGSVTSDPGYSLRRSAGNSWKGANSGRVSIPEFQGLHEIETTDGNQPQQLKKTMNVHC